MLKKVKTQPDLSLTSPLHQEAIKNGQEHFRAWQYNVVDHLKGKTVEEIRTILRDTSYPFAMLFESWLGDFNIATGIRNANAFNAREVYYLGNRKIDKRGCVGTHNYQDIQWLPTIDAFKKLSDKYYIVGIDNVPGSKPIENYVWRDNTLLVFGEEGAGLTPEMQSLCSDILHISMYGSVRSINCGTASGIAAFSFVSDYAKRHRL